MRIDSDKDIRIKNNKDRDRVYTMFSGEQKTMFHAIQDNIFTFCEATAGSGKTLVSVASMLDLYANGEINGIIYIQKVSCKMDFYQELWKKKPMLCGCHFLMLWLL